MKVKLTLNEKQYSTLLSALDMYSRVLMGQFRRITDEFMFSTDLSERYNERETLEQLLEACKCIVYPELRRYDSWGISHEKNPMASKIAYNIYRTIRYKLNKANGINNVYSHPPIHWAGDSVDVEVVEE